MRKIASLFLLLALFSVFYGCGSKHSKAFLNLEKEANELERQIQEAVDCDDLMLFSFSTTAQHQAAYTQNKADFSG